MSAQAAASLKSRTFPSAASLSCRQHTLQAQHHTSPGGHTAMWPEERTPSSLSQGRVSPCHDIPGKARCAASVSRASGAPCPARPAQPFQLWHPWQSVFSPTSGRRQGTHSFPWPVARSSLCQTRLPCCPAQCFQGSLSLCLSLCALPHAGADSVVCCTCTVCSPHLSCPSLPSSLLPVLPACACRLLCLLASQSQSSS